MAITEAFVNLAGTAARAHGYPELRQFVLPHPMELKPVDEVFAIARARLLDVAALLAERV